MELFTQLTARLPVRHCTVPSAAITEQLAPPTMPFNDVLFLEANHDVIRVVPSLSTTDTNSVIEEYFQLGADGSLCVHCHGNTACLCFC